MMTAAPGAPDPRATGVRRAPSRYGRPVLKRLLQFLALKRIFQAVRARRARRRHY
jgi:hypothetical protein